jgi:G protein-coupled receptor 157
MGANVSDPNGCVNETIFNTKMWMSTYFSLASSILTILGCCLTILTFILWRDVRKSMVRILILCLAIADLGTGLSFFTSSIGDIIKLANSTENHTVAFPDYNIFCSTVGFFTTFFPVSSFFWTAFLAIYFVVILVLRKTNWNQRLLIAFNVIAWGLPLIICFIALGLGIIGSDSRTTGGWCFVSLKSLENYEINKTIIYLVYILFEGIVGKGWEILSYIVVIFSYTVIIIVNRSRCIHKICSRRKLRRNNVDASLSATQSTSSSHLLIFNQAVIKMDWKLVLIPVLFIFLRFFGTYRYFWSMTSSCNNQSCHCSNQSCSTVTDDCYNVGYNYSVFLYFHAFCDPLQGFANTIIFVFCSKGIMKRFYNAFKRCCAAIKLRSKTQPTSVVPDFSEHQVNHKNSVINEREHLIISTEYGSINDSTELHSNQVIEFKNE